MKTERYDDRRPSCAVVDGDLAISRCYGSVMQASSNNGRCNILTALLSPPTVRVGRRDVVIFFTLLRLQSRTVSFNSFVWPSVRRPVGVGRRLEGHAASCAV